MCDFREQPALKLPSPARDRKTQLICWNEDRAKTGILQTIFVVMICQRYLKPGYLKRSYLDV